MCHKSGEQLLGSVPQGKARHQTLSKCRFIAPGISQSDTLGCSRLFHRHLIGDVKPYATDAGLSYSTGHAGDHNGPAEGGSDSDPAGLKACTPPGVPCYHTGSQAVHKLHQQCHISTIKPSAKAASSRLPAADKPTLRWDCGSKMT